MTRRLPAMLAALCLLPLCFARQEAARQPMPAWAADRLSELRPTRPMDYFELGEEISYEITGRAGQDLARTLFVLAYQLDDDLGPHVCLALADLTTSTDERRWLLAMAESMGSTDTGANNPRSESRANLEIRRRLADGLRTLRAEDGRAMREALSGPASAEFLAQLQQAEPVIYSAINEAAQIASSKNGCPRCRGQRVVANGANSTRQRVLCPRCGGNPGLILTETDTINSLRIEANLRRVEPSTWSATLLLHQDRPLRDIRAGDLARSYAVDGAKTHWSRDLGWHAPTESPVSP